eukprot:gene2957-5807_t
MTTSIAPSSTLSFSSLTQATSIGLDLKLARSSTLNITSRWDDNCEMKFVQGEISNFEINYDKEMNHISVSLNVPLQDSELYISIPEMTSIQVEACSLNLVTKNKILGDMLLQCKDGQIFLDKVRGDDIYLDCGTANIHISKQLEGRQVYLKGNDVIGKMIHGDSFNVISKGKTDLAAVYAQSTQIISDGTVSIGLIQGLSQVECKSGNVKLTGVDGPCAIVAHNGDASLQINQMNGHGVSVTCSNGNVLLSVDPELVGNVHLEGGVGSHSNIETIPRVSVVSDAFSGDIMSSTAIGTLSGLSAALKRPTFGTDGKASGKINLPGAEAQAQHWTKPSEKSIAEEEDSVSTLRVQASGEVRLETLSWMEAMRRRHGISCDNYSFKPKRSKGKDVMED